MEVNANIAEKAVNAYEKIEKTVVEKYNNIEDAFVERYLKKEGESVAQAKERLKKSHKEK